MNRPAGEFSNSSQVDFTSPRELLARSLEPLPIISYKNLYNESEFETFYPKIMLGLRDSFKAPENSSPKPK